MLVGDPIKPGLYVVLQKWLSGAKDEECILEIVRMGSATSTGAEEK